MLVKDMPTSAWSDVNQWLRDDPTHDNGLRDASSMSRLPEQLAGWDDGESDSSEEVRNPLLHVN